MHLIGSYRLEVFTNSDLYDYAFNIVQSLFHSSGLFSSFIPDGIAVAFVPQAHQDNRGWQAYSTLDLYNSLYYFTSKIGITSPQLIFFVLVSFFIISVGNDLFIV